MALEKQLVVDKIEVVENGWRSQVRTATRIVEDGNVISQSYHRHTIAPGQDYSNECDKVKAICQATHTAEVIAAYQAMQEANRLPEGE
jgi:hypothetical protein